MLNCREMESDVGSEGMSLVLQGDRESYENGKLVRL